MRLYTLIFLATMLFPTLLMSQVSEDAQKLFDAGKYSQAKQLLEKELEENPSNVSINYLLGRTALYTGDIETAKQTLTLAKNKRMNDATLYLGRLYAMQYDFANAEKEFKLYERAMRRNKEALAELEQEREYANLLQRLLSRTEDIQIIDSVVVSKNDFLSAYNLSANGGSLQWTHDFFNEERNEESAVVFMNERETKVYFSRPATEQGNTLYTMEKMLDNFGGEKMLPSPINTRQDQAYPFIMSDGLTIYFASKGHESIGGYDIFASRYNFYSNTYLTPNQMNMPFNSPFNDYMMVIDEQKGVGWFASDRYQPEDKVCVYTFIPNQEVRLVNTEDADSLANRAKISNIKDSWREGVDYANLLEKASTIKTISDNKQQDFEFVINDDYTYYHLTDFKSFTARELFTNAIEAERKLEVAKKQLEIKRAEYAAAAENDRLSLTTEILQMERTISELFDQWRVTKVMARNEEIKHINVLK
ncbi:MAG: tetratricopeptide repeat protein [Bacteroidales bacterium]|nr:tetratricopeptide repeat protein [Bacteroidales bacterium]